MARNLPVRTQSLGVGDAGRFMGRGPPRFRPPPPPEDRRNLRRELAETSSEGEDMFESGPGDFRSWDRRKYQQVRGFWNVKKRNILKVTGYPDFFLRIEDINTRLFCYSTYILRPLDLW